MEESQMANIKLDIVKSKGKHVVAQTLSGPGGPATGQKGSVELNAGSKIRWETDNSPGWLDRYEISFRDHSTESPTWPFKEYGDGTGTAPAGYLGPLIVKKNSSVEMTTLDAAANLVAYDVIAFRDNDPQNPDPEVDPLDPMIIIRPTMQYAKDVNWVPLAVVSAVIGAAVGALTVAMLSR
jgi:hypothetical protein